MIEKEPISTVGACSTPRTRKCSLRRQATIGVKIVEGRTRAVKRLGAVEIWGNLLGIKPFLRSEEPAARPLLAFGSAAAAVAAA